MNYTESFEEFASKVTTMDLALYAGIGIVLWVLFKDKLSPIQTTILDLVNKLKNKNVKTDPILFVTPEVIKTTIKDNEDTFFKLVVSWKQTRDLAVKSGCAEAIKVADQMFPYLSPNVCNKEKEIV
jgi:hypothetical protein